MIFGYLFSNDDILSFPRQTIFIFTFLKSSDSPLSDDTKEPCGTFFFRFIAFARRVDGLSYLVKAGGREYVRGRRLLRPAHKEIRSAESAILGNSHIGEPMAAARSATVQAVQSALPMPRSTRTPPPVDVG